jgi:hypothetical protein
MSKAQDRARTANWTARNIAGFTAQLRMMRGRMVNADDNADLSTAVEVLERIEARRNAPRERVAGSLTDEWQTTRAISVHAAVSLSATRRILTEWQSVGVAESKGNGVLMWRGVADV